MVLFAYHDDQQLSSLEQKHFGGGASPREIGPPCMLYGDLPPLKFAATYMHLPHLEQNPK